MRIFGITYNKFRKFGREAFEQVGEGGTVAIYLPNGDKNSSVTMRYLIMMTSSPFVVAVIELFTRNNLDSWMMFLLEFHRKRLITGCLP